MSLESLWSTVRHGCLCVWKILGRSVSKYIETDGELRAASFAYYAFFALFPLLLLFISLGSLIWDRSTVAARVLQFAADYFPVFSANPADHQNVVIATVNGVVESWRKASAFAVLALAWSSLRLSQALVHGVNRAWGTREYAWWHWPLANLGMMAILASTLLLGVVAPVVMRAIEAYWEASGAVGYELLAFSFRMTRLILPSLVLFYGLVMFYKHAPRRKTSFREVSAGAILVTVLLQLLSKGFVIYYANFSNFNKLYGSLGSVIAFLMWIYLSGSLIIFGGCLCAAQSEILTVDEPEKAPGNSSVDLV